MANNPSSSKSAEFKGPRLKLKRAKKHLGDIKTMIAEWQNAKPTRYSNYSGGGPAVAGGPAVSANISTDTSPLPEDLPTALGDFVHNLRASLDHMAADLADLNNSSQKNVQFPFAKRESDLDEQIKHKKFDKAGPSAIAVLKALKPYTGGNVMLRAIHDLDIEDKHQIILPQPQPVLNVFFIEILDTLFGPQATLGPPSDDTPTELVFPTTSHLGGKPFIQTLEELVEVTESTLEAFAVLYPSQSAAS